MFRTRTTVLTQTLTTCVAVTHTRDIRSTNLLLQWSVRDGLLRAHWERESHDLTEDRARSVGSVAA
jgi:hypothetical protein